MRRLRPHALLLVILAGALPARSDELVLADVLGNAAMPGWRKTWEPETPVKVDTVAGPAEAQAVRFSSQKRVFAIAVRELPAAKLSGKSVIFSIRRKADGIVTGEQHYRNAKTMLMWRGAADEKTMNPGTTWSDLRGTTDWELHRYFVQFPEDLQFARVHLGLEGCTGTASFADLTITITDKFADEAAFARFLAEEEEKELAEAAKGPIEIETTPGRTPRVFADGRFLPWELWSERVIRQVLRERPNPQLIAEGTFRAVFSWSLVGRANELVSRAPGMKPGLARSQCYVAAAGLRAQAEHVLAGAPNAIPQQITVVWEPVPISPLLFGNNVNAEHLSGVFDPAKGSFDPEFVKRVRPMGIRFLRYPGGCNADVFNWRESIGPVEQRGNFVNYHNGDERGPMFPGVDDVLRWCEQDGMVPILTTAFLYDRPDRIDLATHPRIKQKPYIAEYLKTAEDRVALAADWVEYCNGSTDTPMGKLRAQNGHPKPYGVVYWEIGNESWGADPVGSTTAEKYAAAFPAYVKAMKARDPSVQLLLNGHGHKPEWNDTILRLAGKQADGVQIHIYQAPGAYRILRSNSRAAVPVPLRARRLRRKVQANPTLLNDLSKQVDSIPGRLAKLEGMIKKHVGRPLPVIVSEFGMGNAMDREVMTSQTSAVLVADMLRAFISSPVVQGANKWSLYSGYWFSQVDGPSRRNPDAAYYTRPERWMHEIYVYCRSNLRLPVANTEGQPVSAVVFAHETGPRAVLINRDPTRWAAVTLDVPADRGPAEVMFLSAGHPLLGNEADHNLVKAREFAFLYDPQEPLLLPPMSVFGLKLPN